ncbi:MAG: hypothetical protein P1S46_06790 [bacterium]|nr:hypothetical protein [bacterium]MDT8394866.1 hypothetical protein [bacterium]
MKKIKAASTALALILVPTLFSPVPAAIGDSFDILERRETVLSGAAVDLAVSGDGQWTFVLTDGGEVAIYDRSGKLQQTLKVGSGFNRIVYDQAGNRLLLGGSGRQELRVITLAMRYGIDDSGSPVKGAAGAPVTVAVFDDFQ